MLKRTLAAILALTLVAVALVPQDYVAQATAERSFTIDKNFRRVRRILVRTNAAKQIVAMGDSEFLDQKWQQKQFNLDELLPLPQWHVNAHGQLKVKTNDEYIGKHEVVLDQNIYMDRDQLQSNTSLAEGTDRLRGYQCRTKFSPQPGATRVDTALQLRIKTRVPFVWRWMAKRRVRRSALSSLQELETAVRRVIAENQDEQWLLPRR